MVRILLVEDEPEMAAALGEALKNYDMVVDHVGSLAHAGTPSPQNRSLSTSACMSANV